jgi:hypothetical protein
MPRDVRSVSTVPPGVYRRLNHRQGGFAVLYTVIGVVALIILIIILLRLL